MRWSVVACVAAVLAAGGCSGAGSSAGVSGTVTLKGQPVAEGTIRFIPLGDTPGAMAFAPITAGAYELPADRGPAAGAYRVEVTATRKTGKKLPVPDSPPGTTRDEEVQYIPAQYNVDSQLQADIAPGQNVKDFALQ
jgi:hypothetical protein